MSEQDQTIFEKNAEELIKSINQLTTKKFKYEMKVSDFGDIVGYTLSDEAGHRSWFMRGEIEFLCFLQGFFARCSVKA